MYSNEPNTYLSHYVGLLKVHILKL